MSLTNEDRDWINAQLERIETSLLTGFHKRVSPADVRIQTAPRPCSPLTSSGNRFRNV